MEPGDRDSKPTMRRRRIVRASTPARELRIVFSPDAALAGKTYALDGPAWSIGRASTESITVDDPRMSRRHARLEADADLRYTVEDLGGTNATFLDGAALSGKTALSANQVLLVGDTLFVVDEELDAERLPTGTGDFPSGVGDHLAQIIGVSRAARRLRDSVATIARGRGAVLVLGGTGTGKELVARGIHRLSDRAEMPCVTANCAAIPAELAEAKLFGTVHGDFTGAVDRRGLFEEANGGVIFLDEIGDLPIALQPKLLRVIEDGAIQKLTGADEKKVDVRLVAATYRDLGEIGFRSDLYARFTWVMRLPLLIERRADILIIFDYFLARALRKPSYTAEFAEALLLHSWPMNVRELEQLAEKLTSTTPKDACFDLHQLPIAWQEPILEREGDPDAPVGLPASDEPARPTREVLIAALEATRGNVQLAAQQNGWARTQLYRWLRYANIDLGIFRK